MREGGSEEHREKGRVSEGEEKERGRGEWRGEGERKREESSDVTQGLRAGLYREQGLQIYTGGLV